MSNELESRITELEARVVQMEKDWFLNFKDFEAIAIAARDNSYEAIDKQNNRIAERLSQHDQAVRASLNDHVQKMLSTWGQKAVVGALRDALKNTSTVLKVRPASRAEIQNGEALAVRQITTAELRK